MCERQLPRKWVLDQGPQGIQPQFKSPTTNHVLSRDFDAFLLSKISWKLICAGLLVRYHVSERNAECWKYCAWGSLRSDRRKESKSLRGKISFHSNPSSSVQVGSSISNLLKSSPVNRPIFLRAKTHTSSVATSPELIKSVMVMAKLSMLVARR